MADHIVSAPRGLAFVAVQPNVWKPAEHGGESFRCPLKDFNRFGDYFWLHGFHLFWSDRCHLDCNSGLEEAENKKVKQTATGWQLVRREAQCIIGSFYPHPRVLG